MYLVVLAWANGMSSAVKSVSSLYLSLFLSPRLVYNEIIEHYPCILSLAWVPEGCAGLGAGTCAIPVLWQLLCPCTAAMQVVWEQQAVASVPARLIPLSDTTFLWCMTWAWQSASENRFLSLLFPLGTEVLMTTFEIKIYICLDLAYSRLQLILGLFKFLAAASIPCTLLHPETYSSSGNSFGFVHLASRIVQAVYDSGLLLLFLSPQTLCGRPHNAGVGDQQITCLEIQVWVNCRLLCICINSSHTKTSNRLHILV